MRVLHAPISPLNPYNQLMAEALQRKNISVRSLAFSQISGFWPLLEPPEYDLLHLHWVHGFYQTPGRLRSWAKASFFIMQLLRLRRRKIPVVWTVHELTTHDAKHPGLDRVLNIATARLCHRIIVHCSRAAELAAAELRISLDKIEIVPHGDFSEHYPNQVPRPEARQSLGLAPDQTVILFFGSIRSNKELDFLIREFETLDLPDPLLLIAGWVYDNAAADRLREQAERNPRIRLQLEFIPDEQVQNFFNAANLLVIPYRRILTSGVLELAASFGLPVVAPDVGCLREQLRGAFGVLYNPDDPKGLGQAIRAALQHHHNPPPVRQPVTWTVVAQALEEIYSQALAEKGPKP